MTRFHVITLFPDMIESAVRHGVVGQALKDGKIALTALSPRVFTTNVHQTVDDRPFGGGDGMIMMAEPTALAMESLLEKMEKKPHVIHLSPRGTRLSDRKVRELAKFADVVLIASRYGGIDQRFLNRFVDEEISVGDYVLSGGEIPALVVIDSITRLLPGVLGNEDSAENESFGPLSSGLLEHPQYTRPREWRGEAVPAELLSGHHLEIQSWKDVLSLLVTLERRPDLLDQVLPAAKLIAEAVTFLANLSEEQVKTLGIGNITLVHERLMKLKSSGGMR